VSTPARERSGFGQFQLNRSDTGSGVDYSKVKHTSTFDMAQMLRDGTTLADVAEVFGLSPSTVTSRLVDAGWSSRDGQPLDTFPEPEIKPPHPTFAFAAQPWAGQALCAQTDPEVFFPEKGGSTREAKKVCAQCFVQAECLDWALTTNERFGIWGGLSERERRALTHSDRTMSARTVPCAECPDLFATEAGRKRHARYVHQHTDTERTAS